MLTEPMVRGAAITPPPGRTGLPSALGWDMLIYASRGVLTVETPVGAWVVPPHRAVWVPAGVGHSLLTTARSSLRTLYFAADLAALPPACRAVNVPPLLRELIVYAVRESPLHRGTAAHERLAGVLVDLLQVLPAEPLQLRQPTDSRAARAAGLLREDLSDTSLDSIARRTGTTRRTLERLFVAQTGLTLGRWRQRARLLGALRLLADGETITRVAARAGYATPSAFSYAFRRELGQSPSQYFA
ncbi:MAG: helix-turn-helix transcriptional regulator [Mycobacteriales bacterium]